MGRQIHFYMTEGDETTFLLFVRKAGKVHLYRDCTNSESRMELSSFAELENPKRYQFRPHAYLWNADVSPPPIETRSRAGLTCLDAMQSEVVEFDPSVVLDGEILDGRIYVDPARLAGDEVVMKGSEFLRWHAGLADWIRRNYTYDRVLRTYVSPAAQALANQGWRLR